MGRVNTPWQRKPISDDPMTPPMSSVSLPSFTRALCPEQARTRTRMEGVIRRHRKADACPLMLLVILALVARGPTLSVAGTLP